MTRTRDDLTTMEALRAAATRVSRGSSRLALHLGRRAVTACRRCHARGSAWLDDAEGLSWAVRAAVLAGGAILAARVGIAVAAGVEHRIQAASWLLWPAGGVWLVAAWRCGRRGWKPKEQSPPDPARPEETDEEEANEEPGDDGTAVHEVPPAPPAPAPLPDREQLAAALHHAGTPHCHTAVLAAALGIGQDRARDALAAAGIPTGPVRMRGRGSSTGVRADDFPPLPARLERPLDGVVAAGERANNNNDNDAYYLAADPDSPHRTHVVWQNRSA